MITIYYMCGGYAIEYFSQFLKSLKVFYSDIEKRIVLITNDNRMNIYDEYEKNNISIEVRFDNELSIIPLNKIDILQKYIDKQGDYSIFINPNALFNEYSNNELLEDEKLYFGYINKNEEQSNEYFGFGSLIYGPVLLFNHVIKFGRDYEFIEDENHTDEQKFIRFIEENQDICEYRESSDIYKFIDN